MAGGDHSLKVKGGKKAVGEVIAAACSAAVAFVQQLGEADTAGLSASPGADAEAEPAAEEDAAQATETDIAQKQNKRRKSARNDAASGAGTKKRGRRSAE